MSDEVDQWLATKFPKDKDHVLSKYIRTLYPDATTADKIKVVVETADTRLKALYLIALSRLAEKNTNLRSNTPPGPFFSSLTSVDFEGKSDEIEKVAGKNRALGWPNPANLFEKSDTLKAAVLDGMTITGEKKPERVAGYAARLGITYGINPEHIKENVYRFTLLSKLPKSFELTKSVENWRAINELLFLTKKVPGGFPNNVRKIIVEEFKNVGGKFDKKNEPIVVDIKTDVSIPGPPSAEKQKEIDKQLADEAMKKLGIAVEEPVVEDSYVEPPVVVEPVVAKPDTKVITLQANEQADLLTNQANDLAKKAAEIEAKLAATQGQTRTALENIVNRLNAMKKAAIDCAESLRKGVNQESSLVEIASLREQLTKCTEQLSQIKIESDAKDESVLLINQLADRENELKEKEKQLEECKNSRESLQKECSAKQQELQQQINELEKTRSGGLAEMQKLKAERAQLEEKLSEVITKLQRIAQLKKKCSDAGKTMSEQLGVSTATRLAGAEDTSKNAKESLEILLTNITTKVDTLSKIVSDAYESECKCRDEFTQLSKQKSQDTEREKQLDVLVLEQKETISELRKQIQAREETTKKNIELVKDVSANVDKIRKDLELCSTDKKASLAKVAELEKAVQDLLQNNQVLEESNTKCETSKKAEQEQCTAKLSALEGEITKKLQETSQQEQQQLREKLDACSSRTVAIETTSQKVIEQQKTAIAQLTSENSRLQEEKKLAEKTQRNLSKCENVLKTQSTELVSCQETQQQNIEQIQRAKLEGQKTHDMFIEQTIQAIGRADLDADKDRFASWLARFNEDDRNTIIKGLEKARAEGKIAPNTGVARQSALETEVSSLKKQLYDLKLEEADATEKYGLSQNALDVAQKALADCEEQRKNSVSQDQVKKLQDELAQLTKQRDAMQKDFDTNKTSIDNLTEQVRDLESVKNFGEEELNKCKLSRDSLLKSSEDTEKDLTNRLSALQTENEKIAKQLSQLPSVDPQLLTNLQEHKVQLDNELRVCRENETKLTEQTKALDQDFRTSEQDKIALNKKIETEKLNLETLKTQLETSSNAVGAANKELEEVNTAKKQLEQAHNVNVKEMENLTKDLQNQIERLAAERDTLKQQFTDQTQATMAEKKAKEELEDKVQKNEKMIEEQNRLLEGARVEILRLQALEQNKTE